MSETKTFNIGATTFARVVWYEDPEFPEMSEWQQTSARLWRRRALRIAYGIAEWLHRRNLEGVAVWWGESGPGQYLLRWGHEKPFTRVVVHGMPR